MTRPLAPRSETAYRRLLARAYGSANPPSFNSIDPSVGNWPSGSCTTLRAAIKRRCVENGTHTEPHCAVCGPARSAVPRRWAPRRQVAIPGEADARAYEAAAAALPRGRRALALIPLALGLRAEELCSLTRENVKRAVKTGELITMRKGGRERVIPMKKAIALFAELLEVPAARGRCRPISDPKPAHAWMRVGEIVSPGCYKTQYNALRDLVRETGAAAGLSGARPHLLRHTFATRLNRDGASPFTIQAALDHANLSTTMRYVHAENSDIDKHQRDFNVTFEEGTL